MTPSFLRYFRTDEILESIKEIFEALGQRIRSPFWGYVALSFLFVNWKPLYYLVFADKPALMKFRFFDANTDNYTLYLMPLGIGLIATLAAPYISDWASWWSAKPTSSRRIREVDEAHKVLQIKNQFAAERDNERAIFEQALIDQAKRDEEVEAISDPNLKKEVAEQIEDIRKSGSEMPLNSSSGYEKDLVLTTKIQNLNSLAENSRQMGRLEEAQEFLFEARELARRL